MNYGMLWIFLDVYNNIKLIMEVISVFGTIILSILFFIYLIAKIEKQKMPISIMSKNKFLFIIFFAIIFVSSALPSKQVLIEAFIIDKTIETLSKSKKLNDENIAQIIDMTIDKVKKYMK